MRVGISIITVSFNSEKTIRRTIESVLQQNYSPVEYIIVDGLSNDSTVAIAQSYKEKFRKKGILYRVISEKDRGIYDAMNKGIALAAGEVIGMINSDDWYEKNALKVVAETFEKDNFDMMYADINLIRGSGKVIRKRSRLRKFITSRDWNHPTTFIKKEIYKKIQYNIDNLYADFALMMRIRKEKYKVIVVNEILANFSIGGVSNEKKFKSLLERIRYRYAAYRENGYSRWYIFESIGIEMMKFILA